MFKFLRTTLLAVAALGVAAHVVAQDTRIGVHYPTTTVNGKQSMQGPQIAADMLNAAGGQLKGRAGRVEFSPNGPKSDAILTHSQSSNPASPKYADQTKVFSASGWDRKGTSPRLR